MALAVASRIDSKTTIKPPTIPVMFSLHRPLVSSLILQSRLQKQQFLLKRPLNFFSTKRPMSPHITIYQPQLTWLMSIGHRITGAGLATLVYAWAITASIAPKDLTQNAVHFIDSSVPEAVFVAGKAVLAAPFSYHLFNGLRHLVWDAGRALTLRGVYATGWAVNVATIGSTIALTLL